MTPVFATSATVTLLALLCPSSSSAKTCLNQLTAKSESPTEVQVSWRYSCSLDKLEKVKVYYYHDGFLACSSGRKDGTRPSGLGLIKVFASNFSGEVTLTGLHPASRYMIEATDARLDGADQSREYTEVETKEGLPQAKATRRNTLKGSHQATETSLYWDWGPPLPSLCNESQALPDHYRWHLRSLDRNEPGQAGIAPLSQTSLHLNELSPDSRYELTVNLANKAGEWDERRGLRLPQSTLPSNIQGSSGGVGLVAGLLAAAAVFLLLLTLLVLLLCRRRIQRRKQQKKALNETAAMPLMGQMEGVVVGLGGIGGSPEHEYEKLNYELMVVDTSKKLMVVDNSKKTDPRLNSLGRACKLASTESLDDDGYLKNNDQRVAEDEDVDDEGYLKNNDQRRVNPEEGGYLKMTGNSSTGDDGYFKMGESSPDNGGYLKMTGSPNKGNQLKQGSLQRAPTSL